MTDYIRRRNKDGNRHSSAVTNGDQAQSPGDYAAFGEAVADLAQNTEIQKTFTKSVDAATQGAAQAKINQAARLFPDGWMSRPLGIAELATQVEAGRLTITTQGS